MLAMLLAMILGSEFEMGMPPHAMLCDGPMITMDPTITATYVPEGDSEVLYVGITNNCDQDLLLDLEFTGVEPINGGTTSLGEIRLDYYPDDLARGGEVDHLGRTISLNGLVLPAYETDIRGIAFYANQIEDGDPDLTIHHEVVFLDITVSDESLQPIFHAETALEISVFEAPEEQVGGGGF